MKPVDRNVIVEYLGTQYRLAAKVRQNSDQWLVFIHGWGCAKEGFDTAFESDALSEFSICTFDLLGHGASEKPSNFRYSMEDHAALTMLLIQELGISSAHMVGHSMGGLVGLLCAREMGSALLSFTSVEGNLVSNDAGLKIRGLVAQTYSVFAAVGFKVFRELMRSSRSESTRIWGTWWSQARPEAIYKNAQSVIAWSDSGNLLPMFESISHRMYIYGEKSDKRAAFAQLSNDVTMPIDKSGHFLIIENPSAFYGAIATFARK